jgi:hypothetical protein
MVVEDEPSLFTLVLLAVRRIDAADVAVAVVLVVEGSPLPPQLANRAVIAANIKAVSVLACFEYMVLIQTPM